MLPINLLLRMVFADLTFASKVGKGARVVLCKLPLLTYCRGRA